MEILKEDIYLQKGSTFWMGYDQYSTVNIIMEFQKIIDLLEIKPNQSSKSKRKKWVAIKHMDRITPIAKLDLKRNC